MPKSLERAESYDLGPRLEGEDRRVHLATRPAEPGEPSYLVAFFERDQKVLDEVEQDVLAAMELASPSIAPVVEVFRNDTELGVVHAATPGVTLLRWLLTKDAPPLDDGAALQIGLEICEALAAAHDRKDAKQKTSPLVHPELGPHQVLIAYEGPALVFSFGLGPLFETGRATPNDALAYLAPEVRKGGANGTRANTYSAGAILWSLLAREPFDKDGPPLRKKRTDLDLKLTLLIDRALSPSVLKRTVSCSQLAQAIERSGGADPEARARWVKALRETFGTVTMEATCFPGATPPREDTLVPPPQGVPPTATKPTSKGTEPATMPRRAPPRRERTTRGGPPPPTAERDAEPAPPPEAEPPPPEAEPASLPPEDEPEEPEGEARDTISWGSPFLPPEPPASATPSDVEITEPQQTRREAGLLADGSEEGDAGEPPEEDASPEAEEAKEQAEEIAVESAAPTTPGPVDVAHQEAAPTIGADAVVATTSDSGPERPAKSTPSWAVMLAGGAALFGLGVLVGRATSAPPPEPPLGTAPPTALPADTGPTPSTRPVAAPSPTPSEPPSAASAVEPEGEPTAKRAFLIVSTVYPEAHVYVGGEHAGAAGERLDVRCGVINLRLGTFPLKRWFGPSRAFNAKCGEINEITIAPDPDPYPYD